MTEPVPYIEKPDHVDTITLGASVQEGNALIKQCNGQLKEIEDLK